MQLDTTDGLAFAVAQATQALDASLSNHHEALLLALAQCSERLAHYSEAVHFYQAAIALQAQHKTSKKTPRRLLGVELKLQQTISDIEIEVLRNNNAQQIEQVRLLESATYRDQLTGLHNLRYLQARWGEILEQAQLRVGQPQTLCLIHIGVDQSTFLRDVLGDDIANDSVLRIANVLRRIRPEGAILVAANNNQFRMIWPQTEQAAVNALIHFIQQEVALLDCSQLPEALTVSFGCTELAKGDVLDVLQLRADLALYLALRSGAGAIVWEGAV
nr:GGDEF domain-containing protein [uncultured Deefgea sp.]